MDCFKKESSSVIMQSCIRFIPGRNWNPRLGQYWDKMVHILDTIIPSTAIREEQKSGSVFLVSAPIPWRQAPSVQKGLLAGPGPWAAPVCLARKKELGMGTGATRFTGACFTLSLCVFFSPHIKRVRCLTLRARCGTIQRNR